MAISKSKVLDWLDAQGWPHDPHEMTEPQRAAVRQRFGICGARTRTKTPCTQMPNETGRCKLHGGKSPKGIAHYNFQNKGRSKYMGPRLLEIYAGASSDPDLLSLHRDISMVETRIQELQQRQNGDGAGGDPGELWGELRDAWAGFQAALATSDRAGMQRFSAEVARIVRVGDLYDRTWREIIALQDERRKLIDTETKRREKDRTTMTAEQATLHYQALALAVKKHLKDEEILSAIAEEFIRIVGVAALPRAEASDQD